MSFGKRGMGSGPPPRPPASPQPIDRDAPPGAPAPRMVAKSAGFDLRFAILAIGVVLFAAGATFAATSLFGPTKAPLRPIETVVSGLTRDQVKTALAAEALPDREGAAFMASLARLFPNEHDRLLSQMADTAMRGGDRNSLAIDVNEWLVEFAMQNISALGRTGSEGFDFALETLGDALDYTERVAGGCTGPALSRLENLIADPQRLQAEVAFGSPGYEFNMRTTRKLVELTAAGRSAPEPVADLTPQDEAALQSTLFSLMMDRDVNRIVQAAAQASSQSSGKPTSFGASDISRIDICKLGRTAIRKLDSLPDGTKARVWALGARELRKAMANGGLQSLALPGQVSMR